MVSSSEDLVLGSINGVRTGLNFDGKRLGSETWPVPRTIHLGERKKQMKL